MNEMADGEQQPVGSSRRKRIAIGTIVVVVAVVLAGVVTWVFAPSAPLRLTVSLSPEAPQPYEPFTVSVRVEGGRPGALVHAWTDYEAYFNGTGGGGGGGAPPSGDNRWSFQVQAQPDGTEVWIVVGAVTLDQPAVFEQRTVQIGKVLREGPSGLAISNAVRTPQQPDSLDDVRVSARVQSAANVSQVHLLARFYQWGPVGGTLGSGGGGGGGGMFEVTPGNHSAPLFFDVPSPGPGGIGGTERGTLWMYRVAAWDATGNTAVTDVESFTIR